MHQAITISGDKLSADISPFGAELRALRDAEGKDLQWDGDPKWWTGRAPILFPVVGACAGDVVRVDGKTYPMEKHGFARRRDFAVVAEAPDAITLRLEADDETRAHYPFDFRLDIEFAISGVALTVRATLINPAETPLPASFGYHPALLRQTPDAVIFTEAEPEPIRRIDVKSGLVLPDPVPTPVEGHTLTIREDLFEPDALIWDKPRSRSVRYGNIEVAFPDMPLLGIWTKPGAPYLCIEPWHGWADPVGYTGEYRDKPGVIEVPPGGSHHFTMRIALLED